MKNKFFCESVCECVEDKDNNFLINCLIPGIEKKDINVNIDDENILTVSSNKDTFFGFKYKYSSKLTPSRDIKINFEGIESTFKNGILTIKIPCLKKEINVKKIKIN